AVHGAALACVLAGHGAQGLALEARLLRSGRGLAGLACFLALALLVDWRMPSKPAAQPAPSPRPWGAWLVLAVAGAWHAYVVQACEGPLLQLDSVVNLYHVPPFAFSDRGAPHQPPVFMSLMRLLASGPDYWAGLQALVVGQHACVVAAAVAVERVLARRATPALAVVGGLTVGLDGGFTVNAQTVMSETLATTLLILCVALLFLAPERRRPAGWIVAAALCLALSTLTRQVMLAWVVVGALGVVLGGARPRWRLTASFVGVALAPVALMVLHNYVFTGRAAFTAAVGRNLTYRVLVDTPPLPRNTDPAVDPWEQARRLAWAQRHSCWTGPYGALHDELGWTDAQIDEAFQRFYLEQWRRYPRYYARQTLDYMGRLLVGGDTFAVNVALHNAVHDELPPWEDVPEATPPPPPVLFVERAALTRRVLVLLLGALAPLCALPRARPLALCAWLSVGYFTLLTALVELPVPRYRLPAAAFVVICAVLTLDGLYRRLARKLPPTPDPDPEQPVPDALAAPASSTPRAPAPLGLAALAALPPLWGVAFVGGGALAILGHAALAVLLAAVASRGLGGRPTPPTWLHRGCWVVGCGALALSAALVAWPTHWLGAAAQRGLQLSCGLAATGCLLALLRAAASASHAREAPSTDDPPGVAGTDPA
ncbi:MAG: hypothetical protein KDD82_04320, partial [Planctomycetes bacterium]|nr:hypothetical protein [Planctomycetota bacterium]